MPEATGLRLIPCTAEQLVAIVEQPDSFETALGFDVAEGLRSFFVAGEVPEAWLRSLRVRSGADPWTLGFAVVLEPEEKIIGTAGFKGPPTPEGEVEIAYAIVPGYEGQGYATEAAVALIDFASHHQVSTVIAHTLPALNASARVLTKCGFERVGEVIDPEDGPVWRWELRSTAR